MKQNFTRFLFSRMTVLCLGVFLFSQNLMAQRAMAPRSFEISLEADEKITSEIKDNMRVNVATGLPVALYDVNFEVPAGSPESMAQYYLQRQSKTLGIPFEKISNLRHHATRSTNAGSVVRYRQYSGDYPVNKAEVTISISPQNKVVYVMNTYRHNVDMSNAQPSISEENAYQLAFDYLNVTGDVMFRDNRLMVYSNSKITRLAHEVTILSNAPAGEWHVFVDATNQQIFKVVDLANYYCDDSDKHDKNCSADCKHEDVKSNTAKVEYRRVDGTGMVFDPDPLSSNQVGYGGQYVDNGDATNASLDAARFSVTLNDITENAGTYSLVGPRAEIIDFDTPNTGLFSQNSPTFNFNRNDQGFEPVNTYYHIDFLMNYINNVINCNVLPYQYAGGVRYDPHGAQGADNSFYTSGLGALSFGEGCVDDAEDSDVIHHELGHGLHDWVTSGGLSQVEGLSEGCGDYIAQSYNRGLGNWGPGDAAYHFVFNWDGHNECWGGRTTNSGASYPGGLVGQIHADGQIWATCLMTVWDQIGQQEMDKIFYEGLGMTNGGSSQDDAANAIYQAALNLAYTTPQIVAIHNALSACGYTLPALAGPPVAAFSADNTIICLDTNNTVTFSDETSPAATSWSWTFEGGTPGTSTDQNPVVTYAADGTYDVTLEATNVDGVDTLVETNYITVVSGAACPACSTTTNSTAVPISDGAAGQMYSSVINVTADQEVTDVNVTINIQHTWAADLDVSLTSPGGTVVLLTSGNPAGVGDDDYTMTVFDQEAATPISAGSAPFTGTFIPQGDLSTIYTEMSMGDWTLNITDTAAQDGGQLNSWSLELCLDPGLSVEENDFDAFSISPNPNNGEFNIILNSYSNKDINVDVYDIRGRSIFSNIYGSTTNFNQTINLNAVQSGMYLVKVTDGDRTAIKKVIVK